MENLSSIIGKNGILPVVCLKTEDELKTFTDAIVSTPVRCIEITMRHPFSFEAIRYFKKTHPEFILGAGTIVNAELLEKVSELGIDFCVSPGFDEDIITKATDKHIPFIPGCSIPSEFLKAQKYNINTVKLFPAECMGGVNALKLYESAFSGLSFLPTGGITLENFIDYMACKNVIACGGSFMVPKALLQSGNSQEISNVINGCIAAIKEVRK